MEFTRRLAVTSADPGERSSAGERRSHSPRRLRIACDGLRQEAKLTGEQAEVNHVYSSRSRSEACYQARGSRNSGTELGDVPIRRSASRPSLEQRVPKDFRAPREGAEVSRESVLYEPVL